MVDDDDDNEEEDNFQKIKKGYCFDTSKTFVLFIFTSFLF